MRECSSTGHNEWHYRDISRRWGFARSRDDYWTRRTEQRVTRLLSTPWPPNDTSAAAQSVTRSERRARIHVNGELWVLCRTSDTVAPKDGCSATCICCQTRRSWTR